nr:hypothetical protein [Candidatus Sigynarchaeum springense]
MEIERSSQYRKETAWKIKLESDTWLSLNSIEDSSLPEPSVSIILSKGGNVINISTSRNKFLNLTGVLDSFSQVCLGVEPVLAQEDYAVKEPKAQEKKVEKAEPAPAPKPKVEKVEAPAPAAPARQPEPAMSAPAAPAAPARQPEPAKAPTAESRVLAKLDGAKTSPPPKVAFPPRFPSIKVEEDEEELQADVEEQAKDEALRGVSVLDFSKEPGPAPAPAPAPAPQQARVTINPPAKPAPPAMPTKVSAVPSPAPAKPAPKNEEEEENPAPEWDPW